VISPWRVIQTARATRRLLAGTPVPDGWTRAAIETQARLTAGRVARENGLVRVRAGAFDVVGFSVSSLAYLHQEIFVKLAYFFRAGRPDPVIVDGGSNIGMSVLFFKALYPEARVLAFEPAARAYALLERNVKENHLRDVATHRAALGRTSGSVTFYEDPGDPSTFRMSTRSGRLEGAGADVEQRRLSEFLDGNVDLVKLDIEGAEEDVLADLADSGALERVEQLIVEYHHQLDPAADFLGAFLERLRRHGFNYQVAAEQRLRARVDETTEFQDVLVYARRPADG
jgi:FkbM family methyltransferase